MKKQTLLVFGAMAATALLVRAESAAGALPLMPWPAKISEQPGRVVIDKSFAVSVTGAGASDERVKAAVQRLFPRLTRETGVLMFPTHVAQDAGGATLNIVVQHRDHPGPQRLGDSEGYSLVVGDGHIRLAADAPLGVLRGIETLLQLVQQNKGAPGFSVPGVNIQDEPRFPWRGLSFDVSRHFIPIEKLKQTIDGMAAVKLNVLHWHLSDDQGFRVESKVYPRLQEYGSDGMYYTQAQVRDVLAYAAERGLRVVPEFDMPGHASSWLTGYPKLGSGKGPFEIVRNYGIFTGLLDPTKEYTYQFLDGFIGEMANLFPDEYFHVGGDEVDPKPWDADPQVQAFMKQHELKDANALQAYFSTRVLKIVTRHGKHMEGWDEVLQPGLPKSTVIQSWRGQESLWQAARGGYQGILSAGYYLNLMYPASYHYSIDPMISPGPAPDQHDPQTTALKPGTPAGLTPEQEKLVLGGEAAMWEELATPENVDAKLWPRLAVIAERLWSPESVTDEVSMYRRMEQVNHWLEWSGLTQRSSLELMRQRLAGGLPNRALDVFSSLLEPVKGYARDADKYTILTPLNRLVDAIPAESDASREFNLAVDRYLAAPRAQRDSTGLRKLLGDWAQATEQVRPVLEANSLLTENVPVADGAEVLCGAAQEALTFLDTSNPAPVGWKEMSTAVVDKYLDKRIGDLLIQIAPGVRKLVAAAP